MCGQHGASDIGRQGAPVLLRERAAQSARKKPVY
jgi:hypothetical protein